MRISAIGLSHHNAPLSLRAQWTFSDEEIIQALAYFKQHYNVSGLVLLSTCNRTELYGEDITGEQLVHGLCAYKQISPNSAIKNYIYQLDTTQSVRHLMRVAAGLESMVLGEPQIVGQIRHAFKLAQTTQCQGQAINRLFDQVLRLAKQVRQETGIGRNIISMASAIVRLAHDIFGALDRQRVLFIGAGEMIELCLAHISACHPQAITIANRTYSTAEQLASRYPNANALTFADLAQSIAQYDVIISCTASPTAILDYTMMTHGLKTRRYKPVFIADLAVPRDTDPALTSLDDVFLYTLDDLGVIITQGNRARQGAVAEVERYIDAACIAYEQTLARVQLAPVLSSLANYGQHYCDQEIDRAQRRLLAGHPMREVLEDMARRLKNKLLHKPIKSIRQGVDHEGLFSVHDLFELHEKPQLNDH